MAALLLKTLRARLVNVQTTHCRDGAVAVVDVR